MSSKARPAGTGRIDVHHHAILPAIAQLMRDQGAPFVLPWSLPETNAVMEASGMEFAFISNAIPPDFFSSAPVAARFYRRANEAVAQFVAERPAQFGFLAAVPMPYVDEALDELDYVYSQLRADGILLVPHAGTAYLGDPGYEPLFAELNRRKSVVLVHPMALPGTDSMSHPRVALADFLLDTTRGAINLILSETLDRYPDITFILAHAGGFLPYAAMRVELLGSELFGVDRHRVAEYLQRFYYDTALAGAATLPSLFAAVDPHRIVFGSDWCAAPKIAVETAVAALDGYQGDNFARHRACVDRGNALRLFPEVAHRLASPALAGTHS